MWVGEGVGGEGSCGGEGGSDDQYCVMRGVSASCAGCAVGGVIAQKVGFAWVAQSGESSDQ